MEKESSSSEKRALHLIELETPWFTGNLVPIHIATRLWDVWLVRATLASNSS